MTSSETARLNSGRVFCLRCTLVQWNIGSWLLSVLLLTCLNKCSSQSSHYLAYSNIQHNSFGHHLPNCHSQIDLQSIWYSNIWSTFFQVNTKWENAFDPGFATSCTWSPSQENFVVNSMAVTIVHTRYSDLLNTGQVRFSSDTHILSIDDLQISDA